MTEYAVIDGQRVELTEWFPAEVKPVQQGIYETYVNDLIHRTAMRLWDGKIWRDEEGRPKLYADRKWRGLSHPPGAT